MGMNLHPYNYYILWAAVVLLIIMFIVLGTHAMRLLKALNEKKPQMERLQKNMKLAQIKVEAMQEQKAEDNKKNRWLKVVLPFVLAIYEAYRQDDAKQGLSGYKAAAKKVFADRRYDKRMKDVLNVHL